MLEKSADCTYSLTDRHYQHLIKTCKLVFQKKFYILFWMHFEKMGLFYYKVKVTMMLQKPHLAVTHPHKILHKHSIKSAKLSTQNCEVAILKGQNHKAARPTLPLYDYERFNSSWSHFQATCLSKQHSDRHFDTKKK